MARHAGPIGLRMIPTFHSAHRSGLSCSALPLPTPLSATATGETCEHEQFKKGPGCKKDINDEAGGRARVLMDRTHPLYKVVYNQRTSCERINSQAKELGIERPKVRNARSVKNLNTLTYIIINVRALERAKSINK